MRGKHDFHAVARPIDGLIPACAGKTMALQTHFLGLWAHPRVCGENSRCPMRNSSNRGSSPRVRGKLWVPGFFCFRVGLIPACAGKTPRRPIRALALRAHPRVCGENQRAKSFVPTESGSSPRVRGKLPMMTDCYAVGGLIPACAGKTERLDALHRDDGAHPRVCGENELLQERWARARGSSPRVRGKRLIYRQ